jgi:rubredoxin
MSGGSFEREGPRDVQCSNCGLFFDTAGVVSHETTCDYPEEREPLVEIERSRDAVAIRPRQVDRPGIDDADEHQEADEIEIEIEADIDVDEEFPRAAVDEFDQPSDPRAATDGGVSPLPVPDNAVDVDDAGEHQEAGDDVECPECGSPHVYPVDDLPGWVLKAVPDLTEYDMVCDAETSLRHGHVEVFEA